MDRHFGQTRDLLEKSVELRKRMGGDEKIISLREALSAANRDADEAMENLQTFDHVSGVSIFWLPNGLLSSSSSSFHVFMYFMSVSLSVSVSMCLCLRFLVLSHRFASARLRHDRFTPLFSSEFYCWALSFKDLRAHQGEVDRLRMESFNPMSALGGHMPALVREVNKQASKVR